MLVQAVPEMTTSPTPPVRRVRGLCRAGRIDEAFAFSRQALASAQSGGDAVETTEALSVLAYVHFRLGHYSEAEELLTQAISLAPPDTLPVWIPSYSWDCALPRRTILTGRKSTTTVPWISAVRCVEALWPDKPVMAAQPLLHQATSAIRRALELALPQQFPSRYLEGDGGCVTLRLPEGTRIEHEEFDRRVRRRDFKGALELYRGVLVPRDLYADWAVWERERLALHYLQALLGASGNALAAGRPDEALTLARRLKEDLGIEPGEELQGFHRRI